MNNFYIKEPFELENGGSLPELNIAYHTYGKLNADKSNVVWICHHLTANSDVALWWPGIVGTNLVINPEKHYIICANILGSCYGTTGPLSIDPVTRQPYYNRFPCITIRDMVRAHILLREHLGVTKINLLMGGSMGGYQALEWCVMEKDKIDQVILLSTSASESAWGIAIHSAQRLAIEADCTWQDASPAAGKNGLKAARGIGLLSYRNYGILVQKQTDPDYNKTDNFKASSYVIYQGEKLVNRFNAYSYWILTKAMDSHHLARGRTSNLGDVLKDIFQRALIIGIHSDILCPLQEQQFLTDHIPAATLITIDSAYGHDGFMVETELIARNILGWWKD